MEPRRRLTVLYGSQTGTAQEVAERVGREAARLHFGVAVAALDSFPVRQLPAERLVVYVVSTTGQGDVPDNMARCWRFLLRKSLPADSLAGQQLAVLGLGDSGYAKFNHVAKKLSKRLVQLGGQQLVETGLADDQHDLGPDFVIDKWLDQFWEVALQLYPLPPGLEPISKNILPPPKYSIRWLDKTDVNGDHPADVGVVKTPADGEPYSQSNPFLSTIISCPRLTPPDHFQDVRLVSLDISGSNITYHPGDVAMVQPANLDENVSFFFSLFPHLDPDARFVLGQSDPNVSLPPASVLPSPCTVRQAVTSYFDIQAIPRRHFFELLVHFTTDETEREKFEEFDTAEGQQELYEYCNRPRRNILEVLYDFRFTTPNIPFEQLFNLVPPIKPRAFSIASSGPRHGAVLQLLVAVVRYRSSLKAPRKGLCSTWLSRSTPGVTTVPLWTRPGTLRFPPEPTVPVVMVGPGTGVAPFRSFITDQLSRRQVAGRSLTLYFGCRNRLADYFFADEYDEMMKDDDDNLLKVVTAFSRDQEDKVYVQHRMAETREALCRELLDRAGWFYVAGNSKVMPGQVRQALVEAFDDRLGPGRGEEKVAEMEASGRYQTETWA